MRHALAPADTFIYNLTNSRGYEFQARADLQWEQWGQLEHLKNIIKK